MKTLLVAAALTVAALTTVSTFIAATPVSAEERSKGGEGRDSDPTANRRCNAVTHQVRCAPPKKVERDHCGCPTSTRSNGLAVAEIRCPTIVAPGKVDCNNRKS